MLWHDLQNLGCWVISTITAKHTPAIKKHIAKTMTIAFIQPRRSVGMDTFDSDKSFVRINLKICFCRLIISFSIYRTIILSHINLTIIKLFMTYKNRPGVLSPGLKITISNRLLEDSSLDRLL